ncbi:hypothetical protein GF369_01310 [Candidatus Peregrinibacteria bacterium]|nr:hypothetical protein [Candidatus Peregrinibacteria bacterium]
MTSKNDTPETLITDTDNAANGSTTDLFKDQDFPASLLNYYAKLSPEEQRDVTYYFFLLGDQIEQYQGFENNQEERKTALTKEIAEITKHITALLPAGYKEILDYVVKQMPPIQQNSFKEELLTAWLGLYVEENSVSEKDAKKQTSTSDSVVDKVRKAARVVLKPGSLFDGRS